jgi:hypothetical protein
VIERLTRQDVAVLPRSPARQSFGSLLQAPPLLIIEIAGSFLREQAASSLSAVQLYIEQTVQALRMPDNVPTDPIAPRDLRNSDSRMLPRDDSGTCGAGNDCPDGSCCNTAGKCGYGPENCGKGNCTSNCKPRVTSHSKHGLTVCNTR